jgi:hypothetical protein
MPSISPKHREPNGRHSRKRAIDLHNEDNERQAQEAMATVLAQPHRQGSRDTFCESPLGRFVLKYGLARELYEAGLLYASIRRMWIGCWGGPIEERHNGNGNEVPEEIARKWRDQSAEWFLAMKEAGGIDGAMAVQTMCDGYDCRIDAHMLNVIAALKALGKITGKI